MGEFIPFSAFQKAKEEKNNCAKEEVFPVEHKSRELTPERAENFVFKFAWIVDVLHSLKKADPHSISRTNVQDWRERLQDNDNDFFKKIIMEATEMLIAQHPAYYDAITDEVIERKLNRPSH